MKSENITIDKLAEMVNNGFEKTATKDQLEKIDLRLGKVENKLDKIKKSILDDHKDRIEKLESKVTYLENILNLPIKK